jgi:CubicO group peptidase (beta-lactamase class C family)
LDEVPFATVNVFRTALVALAVFVSLQPEIRAQQNLKISLFERSLEQMRQESGIPGLSVVIVFGTGRWARGFGMADVERSIHAEPDTPYPIGDLTQPLAATLVLQCIDRGHFEVNDRMQRWTTLIPEPSATVGQVLRHTSAGEFDYDPERFAALTPVIEQYYGRVPFRKVLATEILEKLSMRDSVPGHDMEQPAAADVPFFAADDLNRYRSILQRLAVPYRVDIRRRASRSDYPSRSITAAGGLIASALDLANFDSALEGKNGFLISPAARAAMQERSGANIPTGLGWFVQTYNNQRVVWHFGNIPNAFSSLMVKIPQSDLTLILLANSDGLSAPFALDQGDVTASLFARLFLRTFLP